MEEMLEVQIFTDLEEGCLKLDDDKRILSVFMPDIEYEGETYFLLKIPKVFADDNRYIIMDANSFRAVRGETINSKILSDFYVNGPNGLLTIDVIDQVDGEQLPAGTELMQISFSANEQDADDEVRMPLYLDVVYDCDTIF